MTRTAAALLLLLTGCTGASVAHKQATFAPYRSAKVTTGEPLTQVLGARTSLVVRGELLPGGGSISVERCGVAAVVSSGYLLTAAHLVSGEVDAPVLVTWGQGVREAAVVWQGDPDEPLQDLALLRILEPAPGEVGGELGSGPGSATPPPDAAVELPQTPFEWAPLDAIREGAPVVVPGRGELEEIRQLIYAAGEVVSEPDPVKGAPMVVFRHDAPLRVGDSGSPASDPEGRLLGINVRFDVLTRNGLCLRPHVPWLEDLIARDRARR